MPSACMCKYEYSILSALFIYLIPYEQPNVEWPTTLVASLYQTGWAHVRRVSCLNSKK